MFKLPGLPSPKAGVHELADFAELLSWKNGITSEREIIANLGRLDDNESNDGCYDDEDQSGEHLEEVMNEIERRASACSAGYPFILENSGTVLKYRSSAQPAKEETVYLYLLSSTRLNMNKKGKQSGLDGTLLLETLSAHVLKSYLGSASAKSLVFGTSVPGKFEDKVNNLCQCVQEGGGFKNWNGGKVSANDAKLDVVAWIPFEDKLPGQLLIFCQCKTGTSWRDKTTELQPENFIKSWMKRGSFVISPLRAFCVSEAIDRSQWVANCIPAGILFDRCRLVEFCSGICDEVHSDIEKWTRAAKSSIRFSV